MSLTSYRAAPPRVKQVEKLRDEGPERDEDILFVDLAATYSPAP